MVTPSDCCSKLLSMFALLHAYYPMAVALSYVGPQILDSIYPLYNRLQRHPNASKVTESEVTTTPAKSRDPSSTQE